MKLLDVSPELGGLITPTSYDNLTLVSPEGFQGSFNIHIDLFKILEEYYKYVVTVLGEPQLGRRNLRLTLGAEKNLAPEFKLISNFLAYADRHSSLIDIANSADVYALDLLPVIDKLLARNLTKIAE